MTEASVYIEVKPRSPVKGNKQYAYILVGTVRGKEKPSAPVTASIEATWHEATLTAIAEALGRFTRPCKIHLYTGNICINNYFTYRLKGWAENRFLSPKGAPIANAKLWLQVWEAYTKNPGTIIIPEPGEHKYSDELRTLMKEEP